MVPHAVNIPAISPEEADALAPFVPLAAQLARLALELAGESGRIELTYHGGLAERDTRLLTVSALNGAFQGRVDRQVNWVNAPLVAAELGIEVSEERRRTSHDFTNLIGVTVADAAVEGTTIGTDDRRWLVTALGFGIEMELSPLMVFFLYDDVPGVIGRVGTLFGDAEVNIANMAVSRTRHGGKALMALSIDSPAPTELQDRLRAEGFDDARFIDLAESRRRLGRRPVRAAHPIIAVQALARVAGPVADRLAVAGLVLALAGRARRLGAGPSARR